MEPNTTSSHPTTDQQASHSAAPWRFIASDERILANDGCIVVYELNSNEADGRLIAAAPDLLEALKELLASQLAAMPPFEAGAAAQDAWSDRRAKARNDAVAVIAKAEGQS